MTRHTRANFTVLCLVLVPAVCACSAKDSGTGDVGTSPIETGGSGGTSDPTVCGDDGETDSPDGTANTGDAGCDDADDSFVRSVSAGRKHTCAVTASNKLQCWGSIESYLEGQGGLVKVQLIPKGDLLSDVKAISAGREHCVLTTTGDVRCGGLSLSRILLTDVQAIDVGESHACAVTNAGTVRCWGSNFAGELGNGTVLEPCGSSLYGPGAYGTPGYCDRLAHTTFDPADAVLACVRAVAAGKSYTCALMTSGGVRCWGKNSQGQLGDGSTTSRMDPPNHDVLSGVRALSAGTAHVCALMKTGGVRCWGDNSKGQLGDDTTTSRSSPPDYDILSDVQAVSAGGYHTCALMKTGGVRCWGNNQHGELGDGTSNDRSTPPQDDALTGARAVSAGIDHTCAVLDNGGVQCWGNNQYGELNNDTSGSARAPANDVLTGVQAIAAGGDNTCAIMKTGGLRCWGYDPSAGSEHYSRTTPPESDVLTGVTAVAIDGDTHAYALMISEGVAFPFDGDTHVYALMTSGGVREWDLDQTPPSSDSITAVQAITPSCYMLMTDGTVRCAGGEALISDVQAIAAGPSNRCVLTSSGGVRCWGMNDYGQLGDGTTAARSNPSDQDVLTGVQSIAVGYGHTCAITTAGGVRCWGANYYGQLYDAGTSPPMVTAPPDNDVLTGVQVIAAGSKHTCALMTTGGVRCWGDNSYGQLGIGLRRTWISMSSAEDVMTGVGVQAIAGGGAHTCALTTAGGVRCWGSNSYGQLGRSSPSITYSLIPVPAEGTCQ